MKRRLYFPDPQICRVLSHAWDALAYHQETTSVHTPELHLIAKSILIVSNRSTTQQEQKRAVNISSCLVGLIFISKSQYWSTEAQDPSKCWQRCHTDAGHMGLLLGSAQGWLSVSELHKACRGRRVCIQSNQKVKQQLVIFQRDEPYSRNCMDAWQHQPQPKVTVCHLHVSGFSLILKPLAFPRNTSQMNDWKRCSGCGQNSLLFIRFPMVSLTYT